MTDEVIDHARAQAIADEMVWLWGISPMAAPRRFWRYYTSDLDIEAVRRSMRADRRPEIAEAVYRRILAREPDEAGLDSYVASGNRLHELQIDAWHSAEARGGFDALLDAGPPVVVDPTPGDTPQRPQPAPVMGFERVVRGLTGHGLVRGELLVGGGLLALLSDRRIGREQIERVMAMFASCGMNLCRNLRNLGIHDTWGGREHFVHSVAHAAEWRQRLGWLLESGAAWGVYQQVCWFDEPARNDADRRGRGYSRDDNTIDGKAELTVSLARKILTREAGHLQMHPALIVEIANEPEPSWADHQTLTRIHDEIAKPRETSGWRAVVSNARWDRESKDDPKGIWSTAGAVTWVHMHSYTPRKTKDLMRFLGRFQQRVDKIVGLSTDGVRIWELPNALEIVREVVAAGYCLDVMANPPMDFVDVDADVKLPEAWEGHRTWTTRGIYERIAEAAGL